MKHVIAVVWQAVLLYLAALVGFAVGISVPALRVSRVVSQTATNVRTYDFDWLIAALLMYAVLLLIGAARRRVRGTAATASVALILVIGAIALFTQLGVKNTGF